METVVTRLPITAGRQTLALMCIHCATLHSLARGSEQTELLDRQHKAAARDKKTVDKLSLALRIELLLAGWLANGRPQKLQQFVSQSASQSAARAVVAVVV